MSTISVKSYADIKALKLENILEFMKTRPAAEVKAFKDYCNSEIENEDGSVRTPCFFEIRDYCVNKYWPDAKPSKGSKAPTMLDQINSL